LWPQRSGRIVAKSDKATIQVGFWLAPKIAVSCFSAMPKGLRCLRLRFRLNRNLRKGIPVINMDCNINDPPFAQRCAETLLANMAAEKATR
jgi:hypothetical protein